MICVLCAGQALLAICAYSGRVAVAHMSDYTRPHPSDSSKQLVNLFVTVYECESTGELSPPPLSLSNFMSRLNHPPLMATSSSSGIFFVFNVEHLIVNFRTSTMAVIVI